MGLITQQSEADRSLCHWSPGLAHLSPTPCLRLPRLSPPPAAVCALCGRGRDLGAVCAPRALPGRGVQGELRGPMDVSLLLPQLLPQPSLPQPPQALSRAAGGAAGLRHRGEPWVQPAGPTRLLSGCAVLCLSLWTLLTRISREEHTGFACHARPLEIAHAHAALSKRSCEKSSIRKHV